jgi:hypothetical protein
MSDEIKLDDTESEDFDSPEKINKVNPNNNIKPSNNIKPNKNNEKKNRSWWHKCICCGVR